jgi:hypothetical protein
MRAPLMISWQPYHPQLLESEYATSPGHAVSETFPSAPPTSPLRAADAIACAEQPAHPPEVVTRCGAPQRTRRSASASPPPRPGWACAEQTLEWNRSAAVRFSASVEGNERLPWYH